MCSGISDYHITFIPIVWSFLYSNNVEENLCIICVHIIYQKYNVLYSRITILLFILCNYALIWRVIFWKAPKLISVFFTMILKFGGNILYSFGSWKFTKITLKFPNSSSVVTVCGQFSIFLFNTGYTFKWMWFGWIIWVF